MARTTPFVRLLLAAALLTPLALHSGSNPASADPPAGQADAVAPDAGNRITRFDLALVSRTYNAGDDNWTIVADATLTSNRICLPIAFNCIVGEVSSPANASLANLECRSVLWNHLLVFRNHCLKEIFWAGHKQLFRFTWITDPGVSSGTVQLSTEFGRGFLPVTFQQLAVANLTVDLSQTLEISKSCPDTVDSGATLTCQVTVSHPATPGGGPDVTGITVTDVPDTTLDGLTSGGDLAKASGDGTWDCSGTLICTSTALAPGESAVFDYTASVDATPIGGTGENSANVAWTGPSAGGPVEASAEVVVVGNGDTSIRIEKSTTQTQVSPGGQVTWTIEVENEGPLAGTDVRVTELAPAEVEAMSLEYVSGVGTWNCASLVCTAASMPVGRASFTATGTLAAGTAPDTSLVNEAELQWANDILGPDFPITAGSAIPVVAAATTTSVPTTTVPQGSGGAPLAVVG